MQILLIGNYENSRQKSMQRFATLLRDGMAARGHVVKLEKPPVILGRVRPSIHGVGKWLGYVDRFLFYPFLIPFQSRGADVVHICDHSNAMYLNYVRKPCVVTCHDMLAIRAALAEFSYTRIGVFGRLFQNWIFRNLKRAGTVVCVSESTSGDFRALTGRSPRTTRVVENALNYPFCPLPPDVTSPMLEGLGLESSAGYFLHVGGNQWYKNRLGVIRIFHEIRKHEGFQDHHLVLAGQPFTSEMRESVVSLGLAGHVLEAVDVETSVLHALFCQSEALLFPSFHEGFGWPVAEAQACGCPVFTTDRAPMSDVGGDAAGYFDPDDPGAAAEVVVRGLGERRQMIAKGLENARRFSSERMLAGYLGAYRSAIETFASRHGDLK